MEGDQSLESGGWLAYGWGQPPMPASAGKMPILCTSTGECSKGTVAGKAQIVGCAVGVAYPMITTGLISRAASHQAMCLIVSDKKADSLAVGFLILNE
ncbi:hypothetical protein ACNKHL_03225 [Shigella flexneri]